MLLAIVLGILIATSVILMQRGITHKNQRVLHILNSMWLLLEIIAGYFTGTAFAGRMYSENWEMIGFMFIGLPLLILTIIGSIVELCLTIRLGRTFRTSRISAIVLLCIALCLTLIGISAG